MDNKRMMYQVFANQSQESQPRGRPKSRWRDSVYDDIESARSEIGNRGRKIDKNG
jgi:hypothetical protein